MVPCELVLAGPAVAATTIILEGMVKVEARLDTWCSTAMGLRHNHRVLVGHHQDRRHSQIAPGSNILLWAMVAAMGARNMANIRPTTWTPNTPLTTRGHHLSPLEEVNA
jgi:hypothetical protein